MSKISYESYAKRYETTKPIRGRSIDVRPIGQRRRDWEILTKKALDEGVYSYSAKLYQTECVEYLPSGDIILRCGSWPTPITAEFIHTHSPFTCWKQGGKLWIRVDTKAIPLTADLRMNWKGEHNYEPAEKVIINKRVVDRDKAKTAREPFKPFLQFVKTMLALSDGWLMHETCKQVLGWNGDKPENYNYATDKIYDKDFYKALTAPQRERDEVYGQASILIDNEHLYLQLLCRMNLEHFMHRGIGGSGEREAEKFTYTMHFGSSQPYTRDRCFYDFKIDFEKFKSRVHSIIEKNSDTYKVVQVEPTDKGMYDTV